MTNITPEVQEEWFDHDDVAAWEDDAYQAQYDDDPSPYDGTYSEE